MPDSTPHHHPHRLRAEWLVTVFGLVTICTVLAYCAWRIQATNDLIAMQERATNRVLQNQAEMLHILQKYR